MNLSFHPLLMIWPDLSSVSLLLRYLVAFTSVQRCYVSICYVHFEAGLASTFWTLGGVSLTLPNICPKVSHPVSPPQFALLPPHHYIHTLLGLAARRLDTVQIPRFSPDDRRRLPRFLIRAEKPERWGSAHGLEVMLRIRVPH